jgi:hypothetical protein
MMEKRLREKYAFLNVNINIAFSGDSLYTFPSKIKLGDMLPDLNMFTDLSGDGVSVRLKNSEKNNVFVAVESVTIPAGTFMAYKMTGRINNSVLLNDGRGWETIQENIANKVQWMAPGIGMIKGITTGADGKVQAIMELQEIIR